MVPFVTLQPSDRDWDSGQQSTRGDKPRGQNCRVSDSRCIRGPSFHDRKVVLHWNKVLVSVLWLAAGDLSFPFESQSLSLVR